MSKRLDNLFRNKLDGLRAEPSPAAWSKIESTLHPDKSSWKFYLGIAASIALIALISYFLFLPGENVETLVAEDQPVENNEVRPDENQVAMNLPEDQQASTTEKVVEEKSVEQTDNTDRTDAGASSEPVDKGSIAVESVEEVEAEDPVQYTAPELGEANSLTAIAAEFTDNPVAFSAQKVELPKQEIEQPKKGINLKKVIDLARELKTDNESWGSLREAKDELLSLGKKKLESSED